MLKVPLMSLYLVKINYTCCIISSHIAGIHNLYTCILLRLVYFNGAEGDETRISPQSLEVEIYNTIQLNCHSSTKVVWYFSDSPKLQDINNPLSRNAELKITLAQSEHTGYYFCYGYRRLKRRHFWSKVFVKVLGECKT